VSVEDVAAVWNGTLGYPGQGPRTTPKPRRFAKLRTAPLAPHGPVPTVPVLEHGQVALQDPSGLRDRRGLAPLLVDLISETGCESKQHPVRVTRSGRAGTAAVTVSAVDRRVKPAGRNRKPRGTSTRAFRGHTLPPGVDDDQEFEVDEILHEHRNSETHLMEYTVRWKGVNPSTGLPWRPQIIQKDMCNQVLLDEWEKQRAITYVHAAPDPIVLSLAITTPERTDGDVCMCMCAEWQSTANSGNPHWQFKRFENDHLRVVALDPHE
jgi:hypothetical protein